MTREAPEMIGATVWVIGENGGLEPFTVVGFRHRIGACAAPPYFGLVTDGRPPRLPLDTTTDDDGRVVSWVSHARCSVSLAEYGWPNPND